MSRSAGYRWQIVLDRLSREDSEILKLGRDVIRGHTCKVLVLERTGSVPTPTLAEIRAHVAARLDCAPRFRQRVVRTPLGVASPVWLDDPDFDIARHVTSLETERPLDRPGLEQLVARRMADSLDPARPLWHLDLVQRLENDSAALVWRVHHCLADGTTCVRLASAILWDEDPVPRTANAVASTWRPRAAPGARELFTRGVADRTGAWARGLRAGPRPPAARAVEGAIGRELRRRAAVTSLAARVGPARTVAFADAPLDACRRAGKAIGEAVTVNDVVLSILAGAMRAWLEHGGGPGNGIRVKIPVSLHRPGEGENVGNHNSFFFVDLPIAEPDPVKRVIAINRETQERKLAHDAETLYRLGLHPLAARWAMSPRVFTFNVSNVPGPRAEVFVLGARVRELYSLAEIAQHHALRVAVISAAGSLFFGLCADRDAVKDLRVLAEGLRRATEELLQLVA